MSERTFPVMNDRFPLAPSTVPWDFIEPYNAGALRNHSNQSLERLAQRGGLSVCEMLAIIENRRWKQMDPNEASATLRKYLDDYHARKRNLERRDTDGCPCLLTTPCSESCSCAHPVMSGGCERCCRHGSKEQREAKAVKLAEIIDAALAADEFHGRP